MIESGQEDVLVSQETQEAPSKLSRADVSVVHQRAAALIEALKDLPDGDLVASVVTTGLKMLRDSTNRGDMKLIDRSMRELRYALKVFAPYRDVRKISVFGSARTADTEGDYQAAVDFGQKMAERGWMVTTGAGGGIMAAALGGAGTQESFGLAIRLPFEQATNRFIEGDAKLVHFRYFFTRKLMFVRTSHAIALFPGGFGTLDEGFEVLTLVQTGKSVPMPIVMIDKPGGGYWELWQQYVERQLLARRLISESDLRLYYLAPTIDAAVEHVLRFYRNYHSLRYVRETLVIRLHNAPDEAALREIDRRFADIKAAGRFEVGPAHKAEAQETEIADLPRLYFSFNRRDHGRLRMLIDFLNDL